MNDVQKCRSCGKPIIWVETSAGKKMPLDAKPEKRFVIGSKSGKAHLLDTHLSHFATCPDAGKWRKS